MSGYGRPPFNSTLLFQQPSLALRKVIQFGDPNGAEADVQGDWFWGAVGPQTLTPSLYTNNQTFYSPTVTPGAVTLSPGLYTNPQTFYGPTLTATVTVSPSLYTNQQTFYGPTATPGTVTLQPALYTNTQSFYTPSVNQTGAVVYPSLFTNTNIFFAAEAINEYPDPSQVEFGVKYGPGGTLVGTLTGGGGSSIIRLRSFTERH